MHNNDYWHAGAKSQERPIFSGSICSTLHFPLAEGEEGSIGVLRPGFAGGVEPGTPFGLQLGDIVVIECWELLLHLAIGVRMQFGNGCAGPGAFPGRRGASIIGSATLYTRHLSNR